MSEFQGYSDDHDDLPVDDPATSPEVDDADAYEQLRDVSHGIGPDLTEIPDGVDPADAYEQRRDAGDSDDEYDDR